MLCIICSDYLNDSDSSRAHSENVGDVVLDELVRWSPGAQEGAEQAHGHDEEELRPWEEEEERDRGEDDLLEDHCEADDRADHDTEKAARHHEDERLVEVEKLDPALREAHGPEDTDLFGLVQQVRTHTGAEREEAKDHRNHDDHVEDDVENELHDLRGLCVVEVVEEVDGVGLGG